MPDNGRPPKNRFEALPAAREQKLGLWRRQDFLHSLSNSALVGLYLLLRDLQRSRDLDGRENSVTGSCGASSHFDDTPKTSRSMARVDIRLNRATSSRLPDASGCATCEFNASGRVFGTIGLHVRVDCIYSTGSVLDPSSSSSGCVTLLLNWYYNNAEYLQPTYLVSGYSPTR